MPHPAPTRVVRRRRLFVPVAVVVVLAAGWTGFWFYAAARAEADLAAWRESARQAGRAQDCASQSIGGYPFRIEVHCDDASLQLKGAPTLQLKLPLAEVAVQVYDPKLVIGAFTAPLQISEPGRPPSVVVQWNVAQGSVLGLPSGVERDGTLAIENARLGQQDVIVRGAGALKLNPGGGLNGELQVAVVGIEKILKMFDIERILSEGQIGATFNALDRLIRGLGGVARQSAGPGLIAALGERTTLEGKPAVAFPVRFVDGAVFLGPFQVGVLPPLF